MPDTSSSWLDDPGREPAAVIDLTALCPNCGDSVLNPTPVLVRAPHVKEAMCICPRGHTWITKWNTDTDPGNEAA